MSRDRLINWLLLVAFLALVAGALIVGQSTVRNRERDGASTPEEACQAFLEALLRDDYEGLLEVTLPPGDLGPPSDLRYLHLRLREPSDDPISIEVVSSEVVGETRSTEMLLNISSATTGAPIGVLLLGVDVIDGRYFVSSIS